MPNDEPKPRGFAALTPEQRRELAAKGGRSAHARGTAHAFAGEEAKLCGRKGGIAAARLRRERAAAA